MKANEAPEKICLEWYCVGDEKYREWVITPKTNNEPIQYTRTDALVAKIEKQIELGKFKCQQSQENNDYESYVAWSEHIATCGKILSFINTLEVKEVDLEKELVYYHNKNFSPCNNGTLISCETGSELTWYDYERIAKHFFELGLKAQKGENI